MKNLFKYLAVFSIVLFILFTILCLITKIPKEAISDNMSKSVEFYKKNKGVENTKFKRESLLIHYYADSVLLNLIYCADSDSPIESAMRNEFYQKIKMDVNYDFIELVEHKLEPNTQYMRYWHGSMVIIRPLLTILDIQGIYNLNKIALWSLAIALLIILIKKSKKLAVMYVLAMVMTTFYIVPYCFEYSWTFYIMFIVSIIAVLIEKKGDKGLYTLLFISGMVTCYFDFLTTEILTLFVPLLLVLCITKEENRIQNFKDGFMLFLKCSALWGISYCAMWAAKWILASIILNVNALDYIKEHALLRINGLQGVASYNKLYWGAIRNNWITIYPINIIKEEGILIAISGVLLLTFIVLVDWKKVKEDKFYIVLLIIALMPYLRYLVLANHSYRHCFFTFRDQIISIICIGIVLINCFNKRLWLKKVELKKE